MHLSNLYVLQLQVSFHKIQTPITCLWFSLSESSPQCQRLVWLHKTYRRECAFLWRQPRANDWSVWRREYSRSLNIHEVSSKAAYERKRKMMVVRVDKNVEVESPLFPKCRLTKANFWWCAGYVPLRPESQSGTDTAHPEMEDAEGQPAPRMKQQEGTMTTVGKMHHSLVFWPDLCSLPNVSTIIGLEVRQGLLKNSLLKLLASSFFPALSSY